MEEGYGFLTTGTVLVGTVSEAVLRLLGKNRKKPYQNGSPLNIRCGFFL